MTKTNYAKLPENKEESTMKTQKLSQSGNLTLRNAIKRGIYKELYTKKMLTEQQLNGLLAQIK